MSKPEPGLWAPIRLGLASLGIIALGEFLRRLNDLIEARESRER